MKIAAVPCISSTSADPARVSTRSMIAEIEHHAAIIAGGIPIVGRIFWVALALGYMAVAFGVIP